jgi:hypothetical protein
LCAAHDDFKNFEALRENLSRARPKDTVLNYAGRDPKGRRLIRKTRTTRMPIKLRGGKTGPTGFCWTQRLYPPRAAPLSVSHTRPDLFEEGIRRVVLVHFRN